MLLTHALRYFDTSSGRFLARDPIGIRGGLNVFSYVINSPTVAVDPLGLEKDIFDCMRACDNWYRGGGMLCNATAAITDCYNSCSQDFWPIPGPWHPPKVLPPPNFSPWPDPCPPCSTGVPSPGGGRPGKPVGPPNLPVNPPSCGCGCGVAASIMLLMWAGLITGRRRRRHDAGTQFK